MRERRWQRALQRRRLWGGGVLSRYRCQSDKVCSLGDETVFFFFPTPKTISARLRSLSRAHFFGYWLKSKGCNVIIVTRLLFSLVDDTFFSSASGFDALHATAASSVR